MGEPYRTLELIVSGVNRSAVLRVTSDDGAGDYQVGISGLANTEPQNTGGTYTCFAGQPFVIFAKDLAMDPDGHSFVLDCGTTTRLSSQVTHRQEPPRKWTGGSEPAVRHMPQQESRAGGQAGRIENTVWQSTFAKLPVKVDPGGIPENHLKGQRHFSGMTLTSPEGRVRFFHL